MAAGAGDGAWSPSSRRAWIEIKGRKRCKSVKMSPSSRRAWIEILLSPDACIRAMVALLAEGVDRNVTTAGGVTYAYPVALLAEGVDRNISKRSTDGQ